MDINGIKPEREAIIIDFPDSLTEIGFVFLLKEIIYLNIGNPDRLDLLMI